MIVQGAHLVGSVPLADAESVFRTVAGALGDHLARLPDGETGARKDWIAWQYAVLAATPGLAPVEVGDRGYLRRQLVRLVGARGAPRFGELGYADAAIASYAIFERLQRDGAIAQGVRFQVSLPTPLAPVTVFVHRDDRSVVEPAYETRLLVELGRIVDAIPHDRLAIQWDVAVEVALLEGAWPAHFADVERGVHVRLARLAAALPRDVEVGFHLCYGDFGHKHFKNPVDASLLVRLANALPRTAAWVHMPVPIGWSDRAAYAPLGQLALATATDVYLGVVHASDGLAGARRRIALAGELVPRFGIATECGWGRRPAHIVPELLDLHTALLVAKGTQGLRASP
ncbi:MAG: hypothetical protein ACM31C_18340 [Acidobacteriota bacterium]